MTQNRELYIQKYAQFLGCAPDAYSVAAKKISTEGEFISASVIALGLSAKDPDQLSYARKFATFLQNYLGESYSNIDANWLAEFIQAYVTETDTSYRW